MPWERKVAMDMAAFGRFTRTFKQGEMIFSEFEPGDNFYLIQSGRVQLQKIIGDLERTLDILQPSEMFGEMAILENSPRSATAIALDEVKVLEFNSQNFEILLMGNPQIALKLLRMFAKRIYDSKRRFMILTLPEPSLKVADVFLMLDETIPDIDKSSERREFKCTVDDVAHWAGMTTNETRDTLSHFVTQHRIEIFPDHISVKNINDFTRFVGSRRKKGG
jgi:CRP-like cAMP-binding protein